MIQRKCRVCGKDATLKEAGRGKDGRFERTYACPENHKTLVQNGEAKNEQAGDSKTESEEEKPKKVEDGLSGLERLNQFLDELEGKGGA